jgi:hypothetical protein
MYVYWALEATIPATLISYGGQSQLRPDAIRTLNVRDTLLQNLLEDLGVLELLLDLGDNALGELLLLPLLDLALVPHPRVQHRLGLRGQRRLLLELISLGLELGGFLDIPVS